MTGQIETPIVVNPSPAPEQTGTAVRDALLVIAALPALIGVFGTRDIKKIVDFVASVEFAPALGVIITAAVVLWRQSIARRQKRMVVTLAHDAPNAEVMTRGTKA